MMTSLNGNILCITGHFCGEFTGHRWIPRKKDQWRGALMFSLICALNKRLSKQSLGWWFEMPLHLLWRQCNKYSIMHQWKQHCICWYMGIGTKWPPYCRQQFQIHFREWKLLCYKKKSRNPDRYIIKHRVHTIVLKPNSKQWHIN